MTPIYVTVQTVKPTDTHPGVVAEGWYRIVSGIVELTDADGVPLPDDACRREIGPDDATTTARRLLREHHDRKTLRKNSGPINWAGWGSIA